VNRCFFVPNFGVLATLCCLFCVTGALAQGVLAPPPPEYSQDLSLYQSAMPTNPGMNRLETTLPLIPAPPLPLPPWLEWGPVHVHPHPLYRFLYGDGVPARPGEQFTTAINELYPGVLFELGKHWTLDYTPVIRVYSSSAFQDHVDQSVAFSGGTRYGDWGLGLSQTYSSSSQPLVETGGQTPQEIYSTALNANYLMSSALSLELGFRQDFRFVDQTVPGEQLVNSSEWSTLDWLNYQIAPRLGVAVGAGFGYVDVSAGSDSTYEQLQARITWRPGEKLSLTVSGGVDYRQFLVSDTPNLLNPILNFSALYHLFDPTTLSLNVNQTVNSSYFLAQVTEITDISGTLRQRLLKNFYLDLSGGYRITSYKETLFIYHLVREDHYSYVDVRLSVPILKRATAAIFYLASDNSSTAQGFAFTSRQVGFELGYRF
jgi:hypothetical protein